MSRITHRLPGVALAALVLFAATQLVTAELVRDTEPYLATAYSMGSITKSGEEVREGIVAADHRVIPLGSEVLITGAGEYSGKYHVLDTGARIKGKRLDIYIANRKEAKRFGARWVKVEILRVPETENVD